MKETLKYALAIGITAAAMFAYMYEAPPRQAVHELAQNTPAPTTQAALAKSTEQAREPHQALPQRELSQAELADIDPASVDWAGVRQRFAKTIGATDYDRYYDPMLIRVESYGDYTAEEIAAFNKLHVIKFNPKIGESCERMSAEIDGMGDSDGVIEQCFPILQYPPHPLESSSLEELVELSSTDPEAAVFASRKAESDAQAVNFAVQAVVLSGKPGPLTEVIERRFFDVFLPDSATREEHLEGVGEALLLDRIASKLGDPRINLHRFDPWLDRQFNSSSEKEAFLTYVENAALAELKVIAELQRALTGSTQIWGLVDA